MIWVRMIVFFLPPAPVLPSVYSPGVLIRPETRYTGGCTYLCIKREAMVTMLSIIYMRSVKDPGGRGTFLRGFYGLKTRKCLLLSIKTCSCILSPYTAAAE